MTNRKPFGRTTAKRRRDVKEIDNLVGALVPPGTLPAFRSPRTTGQLALGKGRRKVNGIGRPVLKGGRRK